MTHVKVFYQRTTNVLQNVFHRVTAQDDDCGAHGSCSLRYDGSKVCICESPWINLIDGDVRTPCAYEGVSQTTSLVVSILVGFLGADWFLLSRCVNGTYVCVGVVKLLTLGGFGVWWLLDFLRIAYNDFGDGEGMPMHADL